MQFAWSYATILFYSWLHQNDSIVENCLGVLFILSIGSQLRRHVINSYALSTVCPLCLLRNEQQKHTNILWTWPKWKLTTQRIRIVCSSNIDAYFSRMSACNGHNKKSFDLPERTLNADCAETDVYNHDTRYSRMSAFFSLLKSHP